jgi:hypothetical protein
MFAGFHMSRLKKNLFAAWLEMRGDIIQKSEESTEIRSEKKRYQDTLHQKFQSGLCHTENL